LVAQTPRFNDRKPAMPQDKPLVIGRSPYRLPVWSAVTLKFIEARDDRVLNRQLSAETESTLNSTHLTGFFWINSLETKPFWLAAAGRALPWFLSPDRPTIWVRLPPKA
jgi:hypothetical protein